MATSDVGRTITVPNDEVITITRHTTILTNRPPPTTSSTSEVESVPLTVGGAPAPTIPNQAPTTDSAPEPTADGTFPTEDSSSEIGVHHLSPGVIVGMSVGGAIIIAIIVMSALFIKRRLKSRRDRQSAAAEDDRGRDDLVEEKHFPHAISAYTTEDQGSTDPFAPFGGE
jgi:hypothetical protein